MWLLQNSARNLHLSTASVVQNGEALEIRLAQINVAIARNEMGGYFVESDAVISPDLYIGT
jgi:hypothetical protein